MNKTNTRNTTGMGWIIAGLLLSLLMASMDNTIVATAMGTIVGELGGLDQFVWVTSAYMVAEMAGMPIFGKLSDMYGRKRFFLFGIIVFMIGSALCGTASSIAELSLFRAIQGIGAGALVPITFTILLDAVSPENRGKLMGLFGAVFGLSSVFGPLLGAFLTDYWSWQWIFYINLPLGVAALMLVYKFYKESPARSKQQIDWLGALSLIGAIICLIFSLELGGKLFAWDSWPIIGLLGGFLILAVLFIFAERRALEPIISFAMFKVRLFASSTLIAVLSGAAFIAASVYLPIYIQGVLGGTATNSGFMLLPMMLGTVVTATLGGFLMARLSYRTILASTLLLLVIGLALLTTITAGTPRIVITIYMIIVGLGIGASFSVLSNAVIQDIPPSERGSATSTLNFLRSLGMMLGITTFGILQNHLMTRKLTEMFPGGTTDIPQNVNLKDPYVLMDPSARAAIPEGILDRLLSGVSSSITDIFMWGLIPAVLAVLAACAMGHKKHDPKAEMEAYGH
ncbi:MDR family MFS transporter [Paenibacillus radicis (ex Gao et al. 2016)]|uniref:MFS transporter n=1 Tax=Paenibacillus radicis (ex Gao et al. 2016) TaxID=1737354 RepID=A0A917LXU0_9BACL|nr:MDR family MFS transporter [Paenibacillus radicis (ex Gao et al. 2016)]GGG64173.1 MFS transporter [Paenibacillus radicis (ex Gao et al. 2016)]